MVSRPPGHCDKPVSRHVLARRRAENSLIRRLPAASGAVLDHSSVLNFTLDGRRMQAFKGDTIASAMAASGIIVTARSFKYHRPRGLFCMTGACANCMVRVNGVPNVQACQTPVREDMKVARQ